MTSRTLHTDDYVTVTLDDTRRVVTYRRSNVPFPTIETLRHVNAKLAEAVSTVTPAALGILIDVRAAPPRNDADFEAEVMKTMASIVARFRAHAFLAKTAVGGLQLRRLASARGSGTESVFSDEADALRHLSAK